MRPDDAPDDVLTLSREEDGRSDEIVSSIPLDTPPAQCDDRRGDWASPDRRALTLRVIAGTPCHAGHRGAARELIAGRHVLMFRVERHGQYLSACRHGPPTGGANT
jgi:hypothetical protein